MRITLYFDGAVSNNYCGYGGVIMYGDNEIKYYGTCKGKTNNYMEYYALYRGLLILINNMGDLDYIDIYGDSKLVINQLNGVYVVKSVNLLKIHTAVKHILTRFNKVNLYHIYRHENAVADMLSKKYKV
jgi:ribonuclease HI